MTTTKTTEKVIKTCEICEELFEDKTRPKNKVTCSPECAKERKNKTEREKYRIENPPKPNQRDIYYAGNLEYPFWTDDRIGRNQMWKEAVPYSPDKIQDILTAREKNEEMGGRRRGSNEIIPYNGDEEGKQGVYANFAEHDNKKPSEVTVTKMKREDIERYLSEKYGR